MEGEGEGQFGMLGGEAQLVQNVLGKEIQTRRGVKTRRDNYGGDIVDAARAIRQHGRVAVECLDLAL